MGAFGYGGLDNDTALDWLDGIYKKISTGLRAKVGSCHSGDRGVLVRRAAAEVLIKLADSGLVVYEETVDEAIDSLEEITSCDYSDDRDPRAAEAALWKQIKQLDAIRKRGRRRRS